MPDTQISDALGLIDVGLQLLLAAVHADDPKREMLVRVGDLLRDVRSLEAALSGHVVVPQSALDWLFGEGPDADGKWFGETIGDGIPKLAGRYPRTYWWRSKFRAMIQAAPPVPEMEG